MHKDKEPLFRKENTKARGVHHNFGGDYRHERNTKAGKSSEATRQTMHGKKHRGLDYTPLFKFLLSKVGGQWDGIYSEAVARLDRPDPVFWLVAQREHERQGYVRVGESSYFSGLYVDADGRLQLVNPSLVPEQITPACRCCTHTLNGKVLPRRFG
jgi:hypothetical protein